MNRAGRGQIANPEVQEGRMMTKKKFELTEERHPRVRGLRRIRAVRDIPEAWVEAGDLGGWIEYEKNLSHEGSCWVFGEAIVSGSALVTDDAQIYGRAVVYGKARVSGEARVYDSATIFGSAEVTGAARVYGWAAVTGESEMFGSAMVTGKTVLTGRAQVYDEAHVLSMTVHASASYAATLTRTDSGHTLLVGCWQGTVPEFRSMILGEDWPQADAATRALRRPELLAFADMCEARIKSWKEQDDA